MDQTITKERLLTPNPQNTTVRESGINIGFLILYFILRIPITYIISVDPSRSHWIFVGIYVAFYLIISALIWKNRMELNSFHIDKFCLFLFILFGSLFRVRGIDNFVTLILEFFLFLFVVTLSIILIKAKIPIRSFPIFNKWNGFAIIFGFVFVAFVITFDPRIGFDSVKSISIMLLASSFLKNLYIEMGSSVIIEEPIFRGFLWGTLRKLSWPESKIFLLQAFLFWISHIYYLRHPFTFWIAAPILSLLLGYLALKTKSIIPPMITHVIYNAFLVAFVAMI